LNEDEVVLTNEEIYRYSRHLLIPEVGLSGQKKLKAASVLIIGAGGLGSPAALYLAAAGVGRIGLVDFDVVDESNLQRQILHGTSWVGKPKLASAKARLRDLNPSITIGRLLLYDALSMSFEEVELRKNPACPVCGENPTIRELIDYEAFCGVPILGHEERTEFDITPQELKAMLEQDGRKVVLLDVREPQEWEICHLEGAILIPLQELPSRLNQLNLTLEYVVYCKTGTHSAQAARIMRAAGFRVHNLRGGINAWSREIDPSVPLY